MPVSTPELEEFLAAIAPTAERDWQAFSALAPAFARLVASPFLETLLHAQVDHCVHGGGELVQAATGNSARLPLPNGMQIDLLLIDRDEQRDELIGYPADALIAMRAADPNARLTLARYRHGPGYRNHVFDVAERLEPVGEEVLGPGDVARVRAGSEVFRLAGASAPLVFVILQSRPRFTFAWQYDPRTLAPEVAVCPDSAAYRLFYAARLLRDVDGPGRSAALDRIARHPVHFVRWAAIQALCATDPARGLEKLDAAQADPHPRIAAAARAALARLDR